MKKSAVQKYGQPFFEQLNGGALESGAPSVSSQGGVNNAVNVSFNIQSGGNGQQAQASTSGRGESENTLVRRMKASIVQIVTEESRPGGALYNV